MNLLNNDRYSSERCHFKVRALAVLQARVAKSTELTELTELAELTELTELAESIESKNMQSRIQGQNARSRGNHSKTHMLRLWMCSEVLFGIQT
jgi:hypothetical protein